MDNFLIKFIILTIFSSGNLLAMLETDEEDIKLSKQNFLISGVKYDEKNKRKGAITLCFKSSTNGNHAALVFEMFLPLSQDDLSVHLVHYSGDSDCCGGSKKKPTIESPEGTLRKVYREFLVNQCTGEKKLRPTEYIRYASWVLPNEDLIKGYTLASNDDKEHETNPVLCNSYTSISYVKRIMGEIGLTGFDFGWWRENAHNLKILADKYIRPAPDNTDYKEII